MALKKPVIIILTSHEEAYGVSKCIAQDVMAFGTHTAVVISDDKYGSAPKGTRLRRLMDGGRQYAHRLETRAAITCRVKPFSRRIRRIGNMIRRFKPVLILAVTPYAHFSAMEAKRRLGFATPVICMLPSYVMPSNGVDSATDAFIVENDNIKSQLVRFGISADKVFALGSPYRPTDVASARLSAIKRDIGAVGGPTVFVSFGNINTLKRVLRLLKDQGDIATYAVRVTKSYQPNELKLIMGDVKTVFVPSGERAEEHMCAADVAIIDYDMATVAKFMRLGVPCIILSDDKRASADIGYLNDRKLCLVAEQDVGIVEKLYELLDPRRMNEIKENIYRYCAGTEPQNVASFVVTYVEKAVQQH